jgi:hypothetical protein
MEDAERIGDMETANAALTKLESMSREYYGEPVVKDGQYQVGGPATVKAEEIAGGAVEPIMTMATGTAAYTPAQFSGAMQAASNPNDPMAGPKARDRFQKFFTYTPRTESGKEVLQGWADAMQLAGETEIPFTNTEIGDLPIVQGRGEDQLINASVDGGAVMQDGQYQVGGPIKNQYRARLAEATPEIFQAALAATGIPAARQIKPQLSAPRIDPKTGMPRPISTYGQKKSALLGQQDDVIAARHQIDKRGRAFNPEPKGKVVKYPPAAKAHKQGWSDDVITIARSAGREPETRSNVLEMLYITKRAKRNPNWGANHRPFEALGEPVMRRYEYLRNLNESINIDVVAKEYLSGGTINHNQIISKFQQEIARLGGVVNEKGQLIFPKGSRLHGQAGNQKALRIIRDQIDSLPENPSAYDMHLLKQNADDWIAWGKEPGSKDTITKLAENPLKSLRRDINTELKGLSSNYDSANQIFSDTKGALTELGNAFGKTLYGESAVKATGKRMRRWIGNAVSADPIADAYRLADDVARRYGANFTDAVEPQVLLANALDDFLTTPLSRTTAKGEWGRKGAEVMERSTIHNLATGFDKGLNKMRGINDDAAIQALEDLVRAGQ